MESIWRKNVVIPERPFLSDSIEVDAAVIGGGLAGVLTAKFLEDAGLTAVVLEADRIGSGQTQNTTAKITSQHGLIYAKLLESSGAGLAGQYARANQNAIEAYEKLILEQKIDCGFKRLPAYLYSSQVEGAKILQKEAAAAKRLGLPAAYLNETSLPFRVAGALRFDGQAQFHPLRFLAAVSGNLRVYEQTRVLRVEDHTLVTNGGRVQAKYIVFACHYPFPNMPGYYFMRMHQERSYVLALEKAQQLDGMYLGVDSDGLSFRNSDELLLLGGGKHRTGENRPGGKYKMLRQKAAALWPESKEVASWSAQDCMTLDGIPYIGPFSEKTPHWYVATGFGKWGMTSSMVAAQLLRDQITGRDSSDAAVFSPLRFTPSASAKNFMTDSMHAVRDLSRRVFAPPRARLDELPPGHGGVVEYDGKKVGVYKDDNGEVYIVSIKCPHLGCQLEWNPDEKSWDCPCHGSRFDYMGRLLDNPAQENLYHI